jgi:PUA domain protein
MFKRFDPDSDISTSTSVKASVQRGIKNNLKESHPRILEEQLDILLPKKNPLVQYKVGPHLMLYCRPPCEENKVSGNEPLMFQSRDGPILPALRFVHFYPDLEFNRVTVDQGAIPFILGGANIMCPGLTNPGGKMPEDEDGAPGLKEGDGVVIYAEGKEHALAVGVMKMSSAQM